MGQHRKEVLKENQLPIHYCAYTPVSRRGRGRHWHARSDTSTNDEVELIRSLAEDVGTQQPRVHAGRVLQLLGLHYRVVLLCTGDLGLPAQRPTIWSGRLGRSYLEVSSVRTARISGGG